jgi:flagellar protein FliO/FliZ
MEILSAGVSGFGSFLQLIGVLLVFVFVLALTYFTTKWIANYQKGQTHNKNLRIVETIRVTNNKYIQLVEAGEEYLVIAIGKDEIRLLTKLSEEQLKVLPEKMAASGEKNVGESFQDVFNKIREHLPKSRQKDE